LLKGNKFSRRNVEIRISKNNERSAHAAKQFNPGDFVYEYTSCVKLKEESLTEDQRYSNLGKQLVIILNLSTFVAIYAVQTHSY